MYLIDDLLLIYASRTINVFVVLADTYRVRSRQYDPLPSPAEQQRIVLAVSQYTIHQITMGHTDRTYRQVQ